jgi:phosphate starvation-inducible membrane PsiE
MAAMGRKLETAAIIRAFRIVGGRVPAPLFSGFVNFFMFVSFLAVVVREFSSQFGGT